jgi:hypothetical protein
MLYNEICNFFSIFLHLIYLILRVFSSLHMEGFLDQIHQTLYILHAYIWVQYIVPGEQGIQQY